jgi:hypothetical protein
MLISISYNLGDSSKNQYFDNFSELEEFIKKYLNVCAEDSSYFELSIYAGKEEKRVRKIANMQK